MTGRSAQMAVFCAEPTLGLPLSLGGICNLDEVQSEVLGIVETRTQAKQHIMLPSSRSRESILASPKQPQISSCIDLHCPACSICCFSSSASLARLSLHSSPNDTAGPHRLVLFAGVEPAL